MVVVVVLLAAFHKLVSEGDGAGAVQAVVDLPGSVAFLGIAQLKRRNVWSVTNEQGIVGNAWPFGILTLSFVKVKDKHRDIPLVVGCSTAQTPPPVVLADGTKCELKLHCGFIFVRWEVELRPPALCV